MEKVNAAAERWAYARVSTREQNLGRQIAALRGHVADDRHIITDKESGKDTERVNYQMLRNLLLRDGDTLIVKSLDRLSRSKADIKAELEYYKRRNIRVMVLDLPTTMMEIPEGQAWVIEMVNNILIEVLGTIAQQERETILQRQAEGIAVAKAEGRHLGRPKAAKPERWPELYAAWRAGQITAKMAMDALGLKRSTFYKFVQEDEDEERKRLGV